MSPQATLLGLGVLLLLAAGVTFLAVTWDSLPVAVQASIIAILAAIAFASAVPASRRKLNGTAEALAILGCGFLTVDLYGVRELGLIPPSAIDGITYAGLAAAVVAAVNLLMSRFAPKVITFGIATVIVGQLPLPLILADRVDLAPYLLGLMAQVVITFFWSAKGTTVIRITGSLCAGLVYGALLGIGSTRVLLSLVALHSPADRPILDDLLDGSATALSPVLATTGVVCLAALIGVWLLRKIALPRSLPPTLGECLCVAPAAFTVALCLPQIPDAGRWLTTGLATLLAIAALLRPRRTGILTRVLEIATLVVASVNLLTCLILEDLVQLGLISAIGAALSLLAAWRDRLPATTAATTASLATQLAILLVLTDGLFSNWTSAITLAVVGGFTIALACLYVDRPLEPALLGPAASAVALAVLVMLPESATTGIGVVLTIAAAPLVAYGMRPARRNALLIAGLLLILANTAFVLGAASTTIEWYTVPPGLILLAIGLLGWRDQPSWVFLGPGLLLGLVPSALVANSNSDYLRTTFVVTASVAIILIGVHYSLQSPFVIGAAVLLKIALWQVVEVAPLVPRWITLALAGLILLTVGATYERRLQNAKQAARWLTALR